jgi:RNA polymerase sigma-70 factor (ECF subfamily)
MEREPQRTSEGILPTVEMTLPWQAGGRSEEILSTANADHRLSRWVAQHGKAIRTFVWVSVRDDSLTEDLVQEVFCRAWEARERYVESGRERAYLLRIADRLVCDHFRRPKREVKLAVEMWEQIDPQATTELPLDSLSRIESETGLRTALDSLSEGQRRILLLRFFGGLQFHEIAEQIGVPLNTVLSHCHRGLLALRKKMPEEP